MFSVTKPLQPILQMHWGKKYFNAQNSASSQDYLLHSDSNIGQLMEGRKTLSCLTPLKRFIHIFKGKTATYRAELFPYEQPNTAGDHKMEQNLTLAAFSKSSLKPILSSSESWVNKRLLIAEFSTKIQELPCALCNTSC